MLTIGSHHTELLAPLTAASELATHPSMSRPYYDTSITEMIKISENNLHHERASLARMKSLLLSFRGDASYAPGALFMTEFDETLLADHDDTASNASADGHSVEQLPITADQAASNTQKNGVESSTGASQPKINGEPQTDGSTHIRDFNGTSTQNDTTSDPDTSMADAPQTNGDTQPNGTPNGAPTNGTNHPDNDDDADNDSGSEAGHRMTTRRRAAASQSHTPSEAGDAAPHPAAATPAVHPLFLIPERAIPANNFGLPPAEADDTRRLLVLHVQKQEEVVRQTEELLSGLMRAERMRAEVLKAAKAEAHVGELSDGEDWYDKTEWGLTDDLAKGKEELVEEEEVVGKKTRGRRN
jgi:hypothetical protein